MKDRADKLLHRQGVFESRKKAQVAIEKGLVALVRAGEARLIAKPSEQIDWRDGDGWSVADDAEFRYVSRAGAKLGGALDHFGVDVKGLVCLDVGLSTGGFTDCLIQRGAHWVLGVDVGSGQLHSDLQFHPKLMAFEKINAREPLPADLLTRFAARTGTRMFDLMVFDVSFISVIKVVAPQRALLSTGGHMVILVKPQFEAGPAGVGKKGLVSRDEGLRVLEKTVRTIGDLSLQVIDTVESSLKGEDGNQEYFILARA